MIRAAEAAAFVVLAAGLHVGLWSLAPQLPGAATGRGGPAPVALIPASAEQATLARAWSTPPELAEAVAPRPTPSETTPAPATAALSSRARSLPLSLPPAPRLPALVPVALPRTDAPPAPPPPGPEAAPATAALPQPSPPAPERAAPRPPRNADRKAPAPTAPRPLSPPEPETPTRADTAPPPAPARRPAPGTTSATARGGVESATRSGNGGRGVLPNAASNAAARQLQAQWGARILRKVHRRLIYPRGASGTGTARIALTVARSGRLVGLRLLRSSGNDRFDRAALAAVRRAGRFPAAPKGLTRARYDFALSLTFRP